MRHRILAIGFVLGLAGCFAGEEPLPPREALTRAAARIEAIQAEERVFVVSPGGLEPAQRPDDPKAVSLWFCTHPLLSVLIGRPELLAAFNARHANAELRVHYIGDWHVAVQKLTVSLAAGDLPDIALVNRAWLSRLVTSGRIAELDTLLPAWLLDDLRPESREAFTAAGHLYAVAADGFCSVMFYNRDRIEEEPPQTWDGLQRMAGEFGAPAPGARAATYPLGDLPFLEALYSAGGWVVEGPRCGLNEPEAHDALDYVLRFRDDRLAHPRALGNPERAFELFLAGEVAMTVASSDHWERAKRAPFRAVMAPVPGKSGPVSLLSDSALVVFRRFADAKRAAIADVLAFLTGPELQGEGAASRGSAPVRRRVAEEVAVQPGLETAYGAARFTPLVGAWGAIEFELVRHLGLAYRFEAENARTP